MYTISPIACEIYKHPNVFVYGHIFISNPFKEGFFGDTPFGVNISGIVKDGSPSPGACGCAPTFSSPPRRLRRRGKKGERVFRGHPKTPAEGWPPSALPLTFITLKAGFDIIG